MKIDKLKNTDDPVDGRFKDGTTEAQRANCRAIYEDPQAYAEWRLRMGLEKPKEIRPSPAMRQRVAALCASLSADLQATNRNRPRDSWKPAPARMLTPEELRDKYAYDPVKLSAEALERPSVREAS